MVLSRYLKLIPLGTQALAAGGGVGGVIIQRKNLENAWQSLPVLWKSTCFSGCLGWVPKEQLLSLVFWVTGGQGVGRAAGRPFAQRRPSAEGAAALGPPGPYQVSPPTTHPAQPTSALSSPLSCCPASSKHFLVMLKSQAC